MFTTMLKIDNATNKRFLHDVARGINQELISKAILIISGFIINILLARMMKPEDYGYVGVITSILFFFEIFLKNGIMQSISKVTSSIKVDFNSLMKNALIIQLSICLLLMSAFLIGLKPITRLFEIEQYRSDLSLILLIIPMEGIYYINLGFLNGLMHFKQHAISNSIYSLTRLIIIILLLLMFQNGVFAVLAGTLIGYIVGYFYSSAKINWRNSGELIPLGKLLSFTFSVSVLFLIISLFFNLDILILSILGASKTDIGFYKAGISIGITLFFILESVIQVIYPLLSKLHSEKKYYELNRLINSVLVTFFIIASLTFIFLIDFSDLLIKLFLGNNYLNAESILPVYSFGMGLLSIVILIGYIIISFKHNRTFIYMLLISLILYVVLIFVIFPVAQLLSPPISLIAVSTFIILASLFMANSNNEKLVDIKDILIKFVSIIFLMVTSIILKNYFQLYFNGFFWRFTDLIIFSFLTLLLYKEARLTITIFVQSVLRKNS